MSVSYTIGKKQISSEQLCYWTWATLRDLNKVIELLKKDPSLINFSMKKELPYTFAYFLEMAIMQKDLIAVKFFFKNSKMKNELAPNWSLSCDAPITIKKISKCGGNEIYNYIKNFK